MLLGTLQRPLPPFRSQMPGRYFTGDGAVRDADGDIQILGARTPVAA